jgi:hypothetical protein
MPRLTNSYLEQEVCSTPHLEYMDVAKPSFQFDDESTVSPRQYLSSPDEHFTEESARFARLFFEPDNDSDDDLVFKTEPVVQPKSGDAPTIITLFYPGDNMSEKRVNWYIKWLQKLAKLMHQMIVYVSPSVYPKVRAMRDDEHFVVIGEYESIWEFPNNQYQRDNFEQKQPGLFAQFDFKEEIPGMESSNQIFHDQYNDPSKSAAYNGKAFVIYDAIMNRK